MLKKYSDKPFKRSENGPVYYPWFLLFAVFIDICKVKFFGEHHEVELRRAHLPISLLRIFNVHLNFRSIESAVAACKVVCYIAPLERFCERLFRHIPLRFFAQCFFWAGCKNVGYFKTKHFIKIVDDFQYADNFFLGIFFFDKNMRVIHCYLSYSKHTAESSRQFVSV